VWIAGLNPGALEVARRSELADRLSPDRMLFNARAAIEKYQRMREGEGVALPTS
jgi:SulP family sulfate permease